MGHGTVVIVELPEVAGGGQVAGTEELAAELRVLWLLDQVRRRRLGHGKASELAGMPRARFLQLMGQHGLTPFDYDEDELRKELGG